jgi:hypothetical protein
MKTKHKEMKARHKEMKMTFLPMTEVFSISYRRTRKWFSGHRALRLSIEPDAALNSVLLYR